MSIRTTLWLSGESSLEEGLPDEVAARARASCVGRLRGASAAAWRRVPGAVGFGFRRRLAALSRYLGSRGPVRSREQLARAVVDVEPQVRGGSGLVFRERRPLRSMAQGQRRSLVESYPAADAGRQRDDAPPARALVDEVSLLTPSTQPAESLARVTWIDTSGR